MAAPKCRVCEKVHWPREGCKFPAEAVRVTKPTAAVTKPVTKAPSVTKHGRPKVHASNAAKQAAYRKRKSG